MTVTLHLTAQPGAKRSEIAVAGGGEFKVRLAAPPSEGKANRELVRFMAEVLDVPRTSVRLVKGANSRHKTVEIDGLPAAEVRAKLGLTD